MAMTDQEKDDIYGWAIDQEHQLTFYQVTMLLRVVGKMEESHPYITVYFDPQPKKGEEIPLWQAPFVMPTGALLKLAQHRMLEELGLIEIYDNGEDLDYRATPKGEMAAEMFVASLENMGFSHPVLISVNEPGSHLYRDDPN